MRIKLKQIKSMGDNITVLVHSCSINLKEGRPDNVSGDTIHEHYMTSNRQRASVQVRQFMASKLEEEYQLYDFIKRRFVRLYNSHRLNQKKKRVIFI